MWQQYCIKKSFYGCSNYPECTFTLAEHFRKKKLTKTNVKELLEGKETLVKGIKNKEKKPYNAVVKIGEKGYIDFISFSKYVVLLPIGDSDGQVVILQLKEIDDETEEYVGVENEFVLETVFALFKERNKDFFTFE